MAHMLLNCQPAMSTPVCRTGSFSASSVSISFHQVQRLGGGQCCAARFVHRRLHAVPPLRDEPETTSTSQPHHSPAQPISSKDDTAASHSSPRAEASRQSDSQGDSNGAASSSKDGTSKDTAPAESGDKLLPGSSSDQPVGNSSKVTEPKPSSKGRGKASGGKGNFDDLPPGLRLAAASLRPPPLEKVLAGFGAYTGLVGTTAIGLAYLAHIDLIAAFRWDPVALQTSVLLTVPLLLLSAVIMVPSWSSWSLPPLDNEVDKVEAQIKVAAAAEAQRKEQSSSGSASSSTSSVDGVPASVSAVKTAALASVVASVVPAALWGRGSGDGKERGNGSLSSVKDGLHLAQGHFLSNNPTANVPPALEAVVAVVDTIAQEMLNRGVGFVLLSRWVCDRLYEAGADDLVLLPTGGSITTVEAAQWAATGLMASLVAALIVRRLLRAQRSFAVVKDLRAAFSAAQSKQALQEARKKALNAPPPSPTPTNSSPEQKLGSSGLFSGPKVTTTNIPDLGTVNIIQVGPGGSTSSSSLDAMRWAAVVQGLHDVVQLVTINGAFILSGGNLAASFAASATNQIVLSIFQRVAMERLRQRSSAMADDLRRFNDRLSALVAKKGKQLPRGTSMDEDAAGLISAATTAEAAAAPAASVDASDKVVEPRPDESVEAIRKSLSSSSGDSLGSEHSPAAALATLEASTEPSPTAQQQHTGSQVEQTSEQQHASSGPREGIDRTISALDMILALDEAEAKAKAKSKQADTAGAPR